VRRSGAWWRRGGDVGNPATLSYAIRRKPTSVKPLGRRRSENVVDRLVGQEPQANRRGARPADLSIRTRSSGVVVAVTRAAGSASAAVTDVPPVETLHTKMVRALPMPAHTRTSVRRWRDRVGLPNARVVKCSYGAARVRLRVSHAPLPISSTPSPARGMGESAGAAAVER